MWQSHDVIPGPDPGSPAFSVPSRTSGGLLSGAGPRLSRLLCSPSAGHPLSVLMLPALPNLPKGTPRLPLSRQDPVSEPLPGIHPPRVCRPARRQLGPWAWPPPLLLRTRTRQEHLGVLFVEGRAP